jgi:valyl-tRNA synthetase
MADFSKPYDPKNIEENVYSAWEKAGVFNPDKLPAKSYPLKAKSYTIVIPPPNVTGSLHMGHALNATIQDILIRKHRMEGRRTLWIPGTDHAGIATQNVVEKDLKKQGLSRHDLGREKFLEKVWEWKKKYGDIIFSQLRRLGASADWSRARFTMDPEYQRIVAETFVRYHKKGWIYRGERVINWCTRCRTSLSDLELEYQEEPSHLWFIKYPLKNEDGATGRNYIIVATTRPETMLGDTAVAVNPKDERYKNIIGRKVILPLVNRKIGIIADRKIESDFGTGAVKVTPAHDLLDAALGETHGLAFIQVIGENGRITDQAPIAYHGLNVAEARAKVVADLETLGLIERIEEYKHNAAHCYRCNAVIEPLLSKQWFVKMDELAKIAVKAVATKKVNFRPARWEKTYLDWLKKVRDWNVSRQIWWGHRLPVYFCQNKQAEIKNQKSKIKINEENFIVALEQPKQCPFCKNCEMRQSEDVLDTWFSSALWPFATLMYDKKDFAKFYPTQVLSTARDIINLWVARMVYSSLEFTKKAPFKDVIIHATILTKDGRRMSKSLGTGIDPMTLIDQFGADATRFSLIWQAMGNQDIHWAEESLFAGKKFQNKIWNATRFVLGRIEEAKINFGAPIKVPAKNLTAADKLILKKLAAIVKSTNKNIDKFEFGQVLHDLYEFFWHDLCAIYLEATKTQLEDPKLKINTQKILALALATSLKLMHPFLPFITEELWQSLPKKKNSLLITTKWPH